MFKEELQFFKDNQNDLVSKHSGKVLVLKGKTVLGVYDTELDAYLESQKEHALGTFMIQRCIPGDDAYTLRIASVTF